MQKHLDVHVEIDDVIVIYRYCQPQGRIEHPRPPDFSGVDTLMPDYLGLSGRVLLSGIGWSGLSGVARSGIMIWGWQVGHLSLQLAGRVLGSGVDM